MSLKWTKKYIFVTKYEFKKVSFFSLFLFKPTVIKTENEARNNSIGR